MSGPSDEPAIDAALLDRLLRAGGPIDPRGLGVGGRTNGRGLEQALEALRRAGCELRERPNRGVELIRTGLGVWADYLAWACPNPSHRLDRRIIEVYRQTASTQDAAARLVRTLGPASGSAIVAAHEQTAGRGRLGRRWIAPPGRCLTFSRVCLTQDQDPQQTTNWLSLAAAVVTAEAIEAVTGLPIGSIGIKWPNDLQAQGRKLAGILVEGRPMPVTWPRRADALILGIGVNVSLRPGDLPQEDEDLRARMTSLAMLGAEVDPLPLLGELVRRLDGLSPRGLLERWRSRSTLSGQRIHAQSQGRRLLGRVVDIDPLNGLLLRQDSGVTVHLPAAETTIL